MHSSSQKYEVSNSHNTYSPRRYDVFLSFSGIDARNNFAGHLLAALDRNGFYTFRDDTKLTKGEDIGPGLLKAIEDSSIAIIIFSKNYAASRWCLDELVKIMDCRRTFKQFVVPVFYGVDPSIVRMQSNGYAQAFTRHHDYFFKDAKLRRWRAALTEAANISGFDSKHVSNGDESKLIDYIVEVVANFLDPSHLSVADYPVGINSRVEKLKELLSLGLNDVQIVAIWGMGGIGKTSTAKGMYNLLHRRFDSSSFLENVRGTWKQYNGPVKLQRRLLSDLLLDKNRSIRNFYRGIEEIKRRAWCRRVLLVLDDVDDVSQLRALAINRDLLHPGSRIIVTTRDLSTLSSLQVDKVYTPEELNKEESLRLFSWHAFRRDSPIEDYEILSQEVVSYAKGLPLVLEILGSFLSGRTVPEWRSKLEKLKKIPHDDVQGKLRLSFDSLDDEQKGLFLDIACFFVGMDQDLPVKILEGRGFFPKSGIGVLARRCLVRIDSDNQLMMHDLIQDMGREIVRQESCREPGERSRLWYYEDVLDVLEHNTGTSLVEGLVLNLPRSYELELDAKGFAGMNTLRLLHLSYVHLTGSYEHLSRRLVWLCWKGFPLKCIPSTLYMDNMVAIDFSYSSLEEVWRETKVLNKLKYIDLSHSYFLTKTPNFTGLGSLEILLLSHCTKLGEVDQSIGCLKNLLVLNMKNCQNLCKLPRTMLLLKSLVHLDISGCSKLGGSAIISWFSSLASLTRSPDSIGLSPASIQGSSCFLKLYLENCNISCVPNQIGSLISLQFLNLSRNNFSSLPASITSLPKLKGLYLNQCTWLQLLPGLPIKLKGLSANYCTSLERISIESKVDEAPFMTFYGCPKLVDNSFANDFRKNLLQYQGLPEQGDFSIFLPGSEVPNWCNYQSMGSVLSFVVPPDQKIQGWILCCVFAGHHNDDDDMFAISYDIHNKIIGRKRRYQPTVDGYPIRREYQMWLNYVPFWYLESEWKESESWLQSGDVVEMSIRIDKHWRVKKCGVSLICEGDEKDLQSNVQPLIHYTFPPLCGEDYFADGKGSLSLLRQVTDHSFLHEIGVLKSKKKGYHLALARL
ncbi:disease resistance protein RPV1-like isoform X2 [Cornus florida]|nr:disease resistance protein RPV1-like isoform X2 [Cornus florida]